MFQLIKKPFAIVLPLLMVAPCYADSTEADPLMAAAVKNAAQYLELATPESTNVKQDAIELPVHLAPAGPPESADSDGSTIYPLGMTKEQYIARLEALEEKRRPSNKEPSRRNSNHQKDIDSLIERIRETKHSQTKSEDQQDNPGSRLPIRFAPVTDSHTPQHFPVQIYRPIPLNPFEQRLESVK